jgi:hypothetical protein
MNIILCILKNQLINALIANKIYISFSEQSEDNLTEFKNIAKYELNC